jgi:hypothetical protein
VLQLGIAIGIWCRETTNTDKHLIMHRKNPQQRSIHVEVEKHFLGQIGMKIRFK